MLTPADVGAAAKAALDSGATHYTDTSGMPELREAVAKRLARVSGMSIAADGEVLITSGTEEALFVALQVLGVRGTEVVVVGPAPRADVELVRALGASPRVAACDADLQLDVDAVRDLITDRTRAVIVHLPSAGGQVVPRQTMELFAEVVRTRGAYAISVETDDSSTTGDCSQVSLATLDGMRARTVTIGGFSWAGLTAWRVAYLVAPRDIMVEMKRLKEEVSICAPAVSQHAALAACQSESDDGASYRERLGQRREAVASALTGTSLRYVIPEAGGFVFIQPPAGTSLPLLLPEATGNGSGMEDGSLSGADGWLRLTVDNEPAILARAVSELEHLVAGDRSEAR